MKTNYVLTVGFYLCFLACITLLWSGADKKYGIFLGTISFLLFIISLGFSVSAYVNQPASK